MSVGQFETNHLRSGWAGAMVLSISRRLILVGLVCAVSCHERVVSPSRSDPVLPPTPSSGLGTVYGVVRDVSQRPLVGVTVGAYTAGRPYKVSTDGSGRYVIADMAPASYSVNFSQLGHVDVHRENIVVAANAAVLLHTTMETLEPIASAPETRWEGVWVGRESSRQIVGWPASDVEFLTRSNGLVSLELWAGCKTLGTYDDWGARIYAERFDEDLLSLYYSYGPPITESAVLPAGRYRLAMPHTNAYATEGCPWSVVLKCPC